MELYQLKPRQAEAIIDGAAYTLAPFTLDVQVWVSSRFNTSSADPQNGLDEFRRLLSLHGTDWDLFTNTVMDVVYYLLEDKDTFPTPCSFKNTIKAGGVKALAQIYEALSETMGNALPQYDAAEKELADLELKKKLSRLETENRLLRDLIGRKYTSAWPAASE